MTDNWIVEPSGGGPPVDLLPSESSSFVCLDSAGKWRTVCFVSANEGNSHYHLVVWNHVNQEKQAILDTSAWETSVGAQSLMIRIAAPQMGTIAWVYAVVGHKIWAWKLDESSFVTALRVPVKPVTFRDLWDTLEDDPSPFTAFNVDWTSHKSPRILLGSASGLVLSVKQTQVPLSFKVYKVDTPKSRFSIFQYRAPCDCIAALVGTDKASSFVSICTSGKRLDRWTQNDGTSGPVFTLDSRSTDEKVSLFKMLEDHFAGDSDHFFHMKKVLHVQSSGDSLFALALCSHVSGKFALYWIHVRDLVFQALFAVDCFPNPECVQVLDHLISSDGAPYAIFTAGTSDVVVMATLQVDRGSISYCSINRVTNPLLGSCFLDAATHGLLFLNDSLSEYRARLLVPETKEPHAAVPKRSADFEELLYKTFDGRFQLEIHSMIFPPAMNDGEKEAGIVACAKRIQSEDSDNPMARHVAYIQFLQDEGCYKMLSLYGKWSLVAIGQEICAYHAIQENPRRLEEMVRDFRPHELANGLSRMQELVLSSTTSDEIGESWLHYLKTAMESAMTYRETHCTRSLADSIKPSYDVAGVNVPEINSTSLPIPIWTSRVQDILLNQVRHWKATKCANASESDMQDIFQYSLQALSDSYRCDPKNQKSPYVNAQKTIFELAHATGKCDEWLFQLCLAHGFFHGLCAISGTYVPGTFDLVSLSGNDRRDVESGETFERYVIKWFAERKRMGLAAKYGMAFQHDFAQLMDENFPGLERYRWMVALRTKDFDNAADSLVRNAKDPGNTLDQVEMSLSLSKLMDHATCVRDGTSTERSVVIEKNRERVMLQRKYFESNRVLDSKELLNSCLRLTDKEENRSGEETLDMFFDSLAVCTTFLNDEEVADAAVLVWFKAIARDRSKWMSWIRYENDLSDDGLLERVSTTTLFGQLVEKTLEVQEWETVCHFDAVYKFAKEKWDRVKELDPEMFGSNSMMRLLSLVSSANALAARTMSMEE